MSFESLLSLGIILFYLGDSLKLLYSNEVIFQKTFKKWNSTCLTSNWTFKGKNIFIPNPLSPGLPSFSLYWTTNPKKTTGFLGLCELIKTLKPISLIVNLLMLLILFTIPCILMTLGTGKLLLVVFSLVYLIIITMLIYIYKNRNILQISPKYFFNLCFDALACPPFSINTIRKICSNIYLNQDAISFANEHLEKKNMNFLIPKIILKLNDRLESEDYKQKDRLLIKAYQLKLESLKA